MLPSLFIAHGAPLLAIENNEYTQFLSAYGQTLPRPRAIVVFSAHWESTAQQVSKVDTYETIYDFGGFPEALYQIKYPAKGDADIAGQIEQRFTAHGVTFQVESKRGLDHGAWVILRLLYPAADIPVVAMSVNPRLTPDAQYRIGQALADLRAMDVLVIGSGGTVHNLGAVKMNQAASEVDDWAVGFDDWLTERIERWDLDALFHYDTLAPNAKRAVPTYGNEHFVPIFYAMGAADDAQQAVRVHRSYRYGNLSHSVWQFG